MKNKKTRSVLLLPLVFGMLTGCNANSGPSADITIRFWHTFGQTIVDSLKEKISLFKQKVLEHDNITVDVDLHYEGSYDDIATKIANGYSVGNRPTIAVAYPDNVSDYIGIGQDAKKEFVVNLEKFINDKNYGFAKEEWLGDTYGSDDFIQDFYNEGTNYSIEGTYSLPYMKSTELMFYNMKLMKVIMPGYRPDIGNSEVKITNYMDNLDWAEFMNLCAYIKENMSKISNVLKVPLYYDSDANLIITKLFQNGIPYSNVDENGKGTIEFGVGENRARSIALLEELNQEYLDGLITTKGIVNKYGSDYFTNEYCVFSVGSSGGSGYNFPDAGAFDLGVCRVPYDNNNPLYVSQGPTLAMFSDDGLGAELNEKTQLYAWRFIKYITNPETNAQLCLRGSEGYAPVRTSAYETQIFQEFMEEGEDYAKCYSVIINDINVESGYLNAKVFKGSAALRDECGAMLTAAIQVTDTDDIPGLIDTCMSNARQKF